MIGSGKSHIRTLAEVANAQLRDGVAVPDSIRAFASIGCHGKHSQNEERDLHRWLRGLYGLQLEIYEFRMNLEASELRLYNLFSWPGFHVCEVPMFQFQVPTSSVPENITISTLLPHEIIHCIASAGAPQVALLD